DPQLPPSHRVPAPRHRSGRCVRGAQRHPGTPTEDRGQERPVRVRASLRRPEGLPLRDQLLPDRDALHPVRHRGPLPLSGRHPARRVRRLRADRDDHLRSPAVRGLHLRVAQRSTRMEV
ncbi:MAG: NADH ubiquinone oxidoreductase chain A, partial [uncultured Solirubrobacteraceae bacterium]